VGELKHNREVFFSENTGKERYYFLQIETLKKEVSGFKVE